MQAEYALYVSIGDQCVAADRLHDVWLQEVVARSLPEREMMVKNFANML